MPINDQRLVTFLVNGIPLFPFTQMGSGLEILVFPYSHFPRKNRAWLTAKRFLSGNVALGLQTLALRCLGLKLIKALRRRRTLCFEPVKADTREECGCQD
ncbi:MAG TPA: hypothetical protein VLV32_04295 [Burkholderiales bacterium]|nr:hypothetical protein [Burkholderiales bacterium]